MSSSRYYPSLPDPFLNPNPKHFHRHQSLPLQPILLTFPNPTTSSRRRNLIVFSSTGQNSSPKPSLDLARSLAASAVLFFGLGIRACSAAAGPAHFPPLLAPESTSLLVQQQSLQGEGKGESDIVQNNEDEETKAAFENLKSRTYALTVPLRIIALRNSVPPLWIKVSAHACFVKDSRVNCTIGTCTTSPLWY